MDNIKTKSTSSDGSGNPLPVLDICNNLITVSAYISAIESAKLPNIVVSKNPALATEYTDWQAIIWESVFESLINATIFAEAEVIYKLIDEGITDQKSFQNVINGENSVPPVISRCDDVEGHINLGLTYLSQLQEIAKSIKNVDRAKIVQLQQLVDQLNNQFDDLEQKLTDKAIDNSKGAVTTIIDVGVAVATEGDPITPLLKGISQVGTDVIDELVLSDEIKSTLASLESAWDQLDQATLELAQVKLILNQLMAVTGKRQHAITALNNIVNDWQSICDMINNDTHDQWTRTGLNQLTEWANRMNRIKFYGHVSQTVTSNS